MHEHRIEFTKDIQPRKRAPGHVTNKAKVTNRPWTIPGVDMRTPAGRRFRDLCRSFATELGGELSELERGLVRQCAAILLHAETQQVALVRGEPIKGDEAIRVASEARRLLDTLKAHVAGKRASPQAPIRERLASRA